MKLCLPCFPVMYDAPEPVLRKPQMATPSGEKSSENSNDNNNGEKSDEKNSCQNINSNKRPQIFSAENGNLNLGMFTILICVYLLFGAVSFSMIEIEAEQSYRLTLRHEFVKFLSTFQCVTGTYLIKQI